MDDGGEGWRIIVSRFVGADMHGGGIAIEGDGGEWEGGYRDGEDSAFGGCPSVLVVSGLVGEAPWDSLSRSGGEGRLVDLGVACSRAIWGWTCGWTPPIILLLPRSWR